jgi:hypothetical protein
MPRIDVERFKKLPQERGEIWQGGLFRMPGWVQEKGQKPFRPLASIWAGKRTRLVSRPDIVPPGKDPFEVALNNLLNFQVAPGLPAYRPFAVEVTDPKLAEYLNERLAPAGVRVDCVPRLQAIDEVLSGLAEHMTGRPELPAMLTGRGATVERIRAFSEAAVQFHKAKPWRKLTDQDLVEVRRPAAPDEGLRYLTVLGGGGQVFGMAFFKSVRQFEKALTLDDPERFFGKETVWSFTFGPIMEMPFVDADLWEDQQLPVANEQAYPVIAQFSPKDKTHRPEAKTLAFIEGLLRAAAQTTETHLDAGEWSQTVPTFDGSAEYRLALVEVAGLGATDSAKGRTTHN